VDNFDLGYAYVWDMEQLSERHSKCLRQKKTLKKIQIQAQINTVDDPFWSEMEYVFLGENRLDLIKDQDFLGDLHLNHTKKNGFSVMMEIKTEGDKMAMKLGKLRKGWVKIIKYYLKVEWQNKGHTQLKKLRSDIFDFPQKEKEEINRSDVFEHEFDDIFDTKFSSHSIDDGNKFKSNLIIKGYGVIAAKRFFNDKKLFESLSDWHGEDNYTSEKWLLLGDQNNSFSNEKNFISQKKINSKLGDDKPCCTIF
jgi:hypothetical protein